MTEQPGVRYGISSALLIAALFSAAAARLTGEETEILTVIVAGLATCGLTLLLRASIGIVAWAMFTGFVINDYGSLTFHHDDLLRLLLFPLATVALAAVAHGTYLVIKENAHE
jgi:hypothetical protein